MLNERACRFATSFSLSVCSLSPYLLFIVSPLSLSLSLSFILTFPFFPFFSLFPFFSHFSSFSLSFSFSFSSSFVMFRRTSFVIAEIKEQTFGTFTHLV